jgi:hypothetical protein
MAGYRTLLKKHEAEHSGQNGNGTVEAAPAGRALAAVQVPQA